MLPKRRLTLSLLGLVAGLALSLASCGGADENDDAGIGCTPNASVTCACPNGDMGAQVCLPDGSAFQPCSCSGGDDGNDTEGDDDDDETEGVDAGMDESTGGPACGDGVEDPGECDEESPDYCPDDCVGSDDDTGTGSTGEVNDCDMMPTYALMIPNVPSAWEDGGVTGFTAGNQMCQNMGADHVCDYNEIEAAFAKGEFAALPNGTTAWLHRNNDEVVDGSTPGTGGRCVDWTYSTNHISDGEFVTFNAGAPTYTIDNDTNYDPMAPAPNPHVQMGLLECGGVNRAILCCHPECMPEG